MGLDDPEKMFPHLIWRRGANGINQHFDDVFPPLTANILLGHVVPDDWARDWKLASADTFAPQL